MDRLEWSAERHGTGSEHLDGQHKELFNAINELLQSVEDGVDTAALSKMVSFLETYAREHFADEEAEADRLRSPAAQMNKLQHQVLIGKVKEFRRALDRKEDPTTLLNEMKLYLVDWLDEHITKVDAMIMKELTQPDLPAV